MTSRIIAQIEYFLFAESTKIYWWKNIHSEHGALSELHRDWI